MPAGEHVVEFRYEPGSLRTGALVSAGSIVATMVLFVGWHLWSRRGGRSRVSDPVPGPVEGRPGGEMSDDEAPAALAVRRRSGSDTSWRSCSPPTSRLTVAELARLLGVRPTHVNRIARRLAESPPPGLLLQRDDDRFQLVTAPASARYIRRLRGLEEQARLSRAALEVLAVVAYRQPATRAEIEAIRGVNGDRALATLLARGLIAEVGRRDTVGRPV